MKSDEEAPEADAVAEGPDRPIPLTERCPPNIVVQVPVPRPVAEIRVREAVVPKEVVVVAGRDEESVEGRDVDHRRTRFGTVRIVGHAAVHCVRVLGAHRHDGKGIHGVAENVESPALPGGVRADVDLRL